ncbi:hypothetical protein MKW94_016534 [Papaver nudicaule]|uniref:U-box domain-containing protein n=1 Tax=Papaver nudicaule TaxID=74823 RepID=A0AA41V627_PAPNU|nr:hypothetical protein [Papaver nudicaule]
MEDPVILPSSKKTIDRDVIEYFLSQDHRDLFDGTYLTVDMLKPNVSLKKAIEAFIKWKRKEKKNAEEKRIAMEAQKKRTGNPLNLVSVRLYPIRVKLDVDMNLDKIPMEFLDPLRLTLMKDPVILPSDARMDRAVIRDHISKFHVDPFSGCYLTEDMLVPDDVGIYLLKRFFCIFLST